MVTLTLTQFFIVLALVFALVHELVMWRKLQKEIDKYIAEAKAARTRAHDSAPIRIVKNDNRGPEGFDESKWVLDTQSSSN